MATLVIGTPNAGRLQQVQVGPADAVAVVTAAYNVWGWVGGLRGLAGLLRLTQDASSRARIDAIFKAVEPGMSSCRLLVQGGLGSFDIPDADAFGATSGEKLVGLTLCALAHVMSPDSALRAFVAYFAEPLLNPAPGRKPHPGAKEALRVFLVDHQQAILNEGDTRRLPELFDQRIAELRLKTAARPLTAHPWTRSSPASEAPYILAFLQWLVLNIRDTYYTRSAVVARLAVALRCVGYNIALVFVWDGAGERPAFPRGLVLVTGGTSETDRLVSAEFHHVTISLTAQYRRTTVGAMLWNAFAYGCDHSVELLQQDFENTQDRVARYLHLHWAYLGDEDGSYGEEIQAYFEWTGPAKRTHLATRLATVLFPDVADDVAFLYEEIASEATKKAVVEWQKTPGRVADFPKPLQRFMALSASICLAVLGKIGGRGFWDVQHSTMFDLRSWDQLRWLCTEVALILQGGLPMSRMICTLATIHCAIEIPKRGINLRTYDAEPLWESDGSSILVGWRRGKYAVLPNLLFNMSAPIDHDVLGLRCVDEFIGNVPTRGNGQIHSTIALPGHAQLSSEFLSMVQDPERTGCPEEEGRMVGPDYRPIIFAAPQSAPPDVPLYINLERSPYEASSGEPDVSLCGRLDGESLGHVSIQDVLCTLALSCKDEKGYPLPLCRGGEHHSQDSAGNPVPNGKITAAKVYNMSASLFTRQPGVTPRCDFGSKSQYHIHIQVQGNTPWAIFLAGYDKMHNRVCFDCVECAAGTGANYGTSFYGGLRALIGYSNPLEAADS